MVLMFVVFCVTLLVDSVFGAVGLTPPHIIYIIADDLVSNGIQIDDLTVFLNYGFFFIVTDIKKV